MSGTEPRAAAATDNGAPPPTPRRPVRRNRHRRQGLGWRVLRGAALLLAAAVLLGGTVALRMRSDIDDTRRHMTGEDITEVASGATGRYKGLDWRLTEAPGVPPEPIAGIDGSPENWVQVDAYVEVTGDPEKLDPIARDFDHGDKGTPLTADFADPDGRRWRAVAAFEDVYGRADLEKQPVKVHLWGDVPEQVADDLDVLLNASTQTLLEPGEVAPWDRILLLHR